MASKKNKKEVNEENDKLTEMSDKKVEENKETDDQTDRTNQFLSGHEFSVKQILVLGASPCPPREWTWASRWRGV